MKREHGFSLIEILVALFLLQLALLALVPMFVYASRSTMSAADMGSVGARAVERMELLRQIEFDNLTAGGSLTGDVTGFFDDSDPDFVVRWRITDNATPPTLKTIEVRAVADRVLLGQPRQVTLLNVAASE
jgi:type II secretory pathway pseudopilin PulG